MANTHTIPVHASVRLGRPEAEPRNLQPLSVQQVSSLRTLSSDLFTQTGGLASQLVNTSALDPLILRITS